MLYNLDDLDAFRKLGALRRQSCRIASITRGGGSAPNNLRE